MTSEQPRSRVFRQVAGREVCFDSEGFLWDADDWTDQIAIELAHESGIDPLSDAQWKVIRFMRDYFAYHGRAPMNKDLRNGTEMSLVDLEQLFAEGIKHGARRLAGLPNPKSCWY
jgi:dissimilatory sulfite reductase related protein